jgi:uncharacterized membrane protein (UPF0127 family)
VSGAPRSHFLYPLLAANPAPCRLVHEGTGEILAASITAAVDSPSRRRGLLGRDDMPPSEALAIAPCSSIHTCFMRFPLDVVWVRADGRVVKVHRDVPPWRVLIAPSADVVIEWRAGALRRFRIERGDRVRVHQSVGSSRGQTSICRTTDSRLGP